MCFYENPQKTSENRLLPRRFYILEGKANIFCLMVHGDLSFIILI